MSGVSINFGAGMACLISVAVCFIPFFVSSPNLSEGTVVLGSAKKAIIFMIN